MRTVFSRTFGMLEKAGAVDMHQFIILTNDVSPWKGEHLFDATKDLPVEKMVYLNGDFITRVFEVPYKEAPNWYKEMALHVEQIGKTSEDIYFFYTTCPKCAKYYGKKLCSWRCQGSVKTIGTGHGYLIYRNPS